MDSRAGLVGRGGTENGGLRIREPLRIEWAGGSLRVDPGPETGTHCVPFAQTNVSLLIVPSDPSSPG